MIILGVILLGLGYFVGPLTSLHINLFELLRALLLTVGVIFFIAGQTGHPVAHRRFWW